MINVVIASAFREENKIRIMAAGGEQCRFAEIGADTPKEEAEKIMAEAEVLIGFVSPALLANAKNILLKSRDHRAKRLWALVRGAAEGCVFRPKVEFVDEK